ncbi:protein lifeguard 4-like [Harmonia axyridis]|uniref:protein lifeguard 4-like n=1 Tax=Harmonia axyridis TaxID=115357 RepID=UPI001E278954|nr:protein lifeguard 4-like [Harmonia axyridis]
MASVPILQEDFERGGKINDEEYDYDIEDDFAYRNNVANAPKAIRLGFMRKVYGLLSMQLLLTTIVAAVCMYTIPVKTFVQTNVWMVSLSMILSFVLLIALHIKRRDTPANLILLAGFTIVEAYTIGMVVSFYDKEVVLQALFLTLAVVGGLTLYSFQTKRDYSSAYSVLFAGLCVLFIGGILQIFIQSNGFEMIMAIGGAFLFSMFIVVDTHMMMHHISPEEYILATINLYLDIINLFLHILRILQASRN